SLPHAHYLFQLASPGTQEETKLLNNSFEPLLLQSRERQSSTEVKNPAAGSFLVAQQINDHAISYLTDQMRKWR
ncbi:hypothetical protein PSW70_23495, partial [Shigella flexneri]|nr:hypothetical protein [Shigella flexneri]